MAIILQMLSWQSLVNVFLAYTSLWKGCEGFCYGRGKGVWDDAAFGGRQKRLRQVSSLSVLKDHSVHAHAGQLINPGPEELEDYKRGVYDDIVRLDLDEPLLWAVLRGIKFADFSSIGTCLQEKGFKKISVTIDTPEACEIIHGLHQELGTAVSIGASTVTSVEEVYAAAKSGAAFISSPHFDKEIIKATKELGLISCPGIMTPTEAFQALKHGADALKVFPAQCVPPSALKTLLGVLPKGTRVMVSGGVTPECIEDYWRAGADGFAVGGAMYRPGMGAGDLGVAAGPFAAAAAAAAAAVGRRGGGGRRARGGR